MTALTGLAVLAVILTSCTGKTSSSEPAANPSTTSPSTVTPAPSVQVVRHQAQWHLKTPTSRAVVLGSGSNLVVAGGLNSHNQSLEQVLTINPQSGHTISSTRLATAVHDAAGGTPSGQLFVFGGGDSMSSAAVQQLSDHGTVRLASSLPRPRSDLSATTVEGTTYLVGGYDGTTTDRTVLATTDGVHFKTVATLPVGVRYAAVLATTDTLWVFGGERHGLPVDLVQRVTLSAGHSRVVGHLPRPLSHESAVDLSGHLFLAGGITSGDGLMSTVLQFDPTSLRFHVAAQLPMGISDMGAAVVGDTAYLVGGEVPGVSNQVTELTLRQGDPRASSTAPNGASWLRPPTGPSYLAPGSDPSVLPAPILIADKLNNRLLIVDPQGRIRWGFPQPGDLAKGQTFKVPDDAFFSPDGSQIIATQEDDFVVSVIDIAKHGIVYRYGTPGVPGSSPNHVNNPDDALLLKNGDIFTSDIKNCRILRIHDGSHRPADVYGTTGSCYHSPPSHFGSPNGAFPMSNGNFLVTEINGAWVDEMTPNGKVLWSERVPGVLYPSDSNEVRPGKYLTVGYSTPGQILEFNRRGKSLWRWSPTGGQALSHPSLALPLPNGDVLVNDDANHRVIVVDPHTNKVVWQYGHYGVAGSAPGYLNNPDGVDVLPPYHLMGSKHLSH